MMFYVAQDWSHNMHHYDAVLQAVITSINQLKNDDGDPNAPYPIGVKSIIDQTTGQTFLKKGETVPNPQNIREEFLPAILYGYGDSKHNDSISKPVGYTGETITILVYGVVNAIVGRGLAERMSDMHRAMRMIVQENQRAGNTHSDDGASTKEARLGRSVALTSRRSGTGISIFHLEFDTIQVKS